MSDDAATQILAELASLRALVARQLVPAPVLTRDQAMELANVSSDSAFSRWCAAWSVKSCGQGRYARRAILAGLDREANSAIRRRRTPKPSDPTP